MTGPEAARAYAALYGPPAADLARGLAEVGEGIAGQLAELSARPSPDAAERAARNLEGARFACLKLRERLLAEGGTGGHE